MTTPFIITGVPTTPGSNGSVPIRHEIRDLQQNYPEQYELLCQGLLAFQNTDENDQLSYYRIAGIHGCPYEAWNGVTGRDGAQSGYCTHSSILFLPWHRPYLGLFEQVLCSKVLEIAKTYTGTLKSKYVSAANAFRLPYWDWGLQPQAGKPPFPSSIAGPVEIQVTGQDGEKKTIPNPLVQYNFSANILNSGDFPDAPYNTWLSTFRCPIDSSPNTSSQEEFVNSNIASQLQQIRGQIRKIFTLSDFGAFSNDKWNPGNPGNYASLEGIHNNIHVLVGGPSPGDQSAPAGNMSIVPYAAFDPVFWLHHCNVDRICAMFEALYPGSYVKNEPSADGTFTEEPGYTETATSDLTPFWKDNSTFYTSQTARSTITFGYCYPETQPWNYSTTALYQKSIQAAVKKQYGTTISSSGAIPLPLPGSLKAAPGFQQGNGAANGKPILPHVLSREINAEEPLEGSAPVSTDETDIKNKKQPEDTSLLSKIGGKIKSATAKAGSLVREGNGSVMDKLSDGASDTTTPAKHKEWIVNIRVQKHCLGGPFSIHCFLGPVPSDTSSWLIHANNVGTCSILGSDRATTSCEKCKMDADRNIIVTGVVMLTDALTDEILKGNLQSLEPVDVEPYLTKMLHWRVTQTDGTEKRREEVDDLQVSVVSTEFTASTEPDEFPVYSGEYTLHPVCTQGRPGGYSHGDQY